MAWLLGDRTVRRVLVSRLRYLGDIVMSTVLLDVLRRGDPELTLGYLLEAPYGPALAGRPDLDRLHVLGVRRRGADARARRHDTAFPAAGAGTLALVRELRQSRYDLAVDLLFNPRSSLLLYMAGIPGRIGGSPGWRRSLFTRTVTPQDGWLDQPGLGELAGGALGHHLCRLQPLVHGESGLPFFAWLQATFRPGEIRPRLGPAGALKPFPGGVGPAAGSRFRLLVPGATWPSKTWPPSRWVELIEELAIADRDEIWVVRPPGPLQGLADLAGAIPGGRGGILPVLPLGDVLNLLGAAQAVLAVDGGIMHAAVALGVPTVGIFGPTDPQIWFPYLQAGPFKVVCLKPPCHPCDRHFCGEFICLPDLTAGPVMAALDSLPGLSKGN